MKRWNLTWSKLLPFKETGINKLSDKLPGAYRLSFKAEDGNFYVFYIGQSEDIKNLFLQYLSDSDDNVCVKLYLKKRSCYFRYAKISNKEVRDAAERKMFYHYMPPCNDKEVEGSEHIDVNLN